MIESDDFQSSLNRKEKKIPVSVFIGIGLIIIAEFLLFSGVPVIDWYFTPFVWSCYIIVMDGVVWYLRSESLVRNRTKEFTVLCFLSIGFWLIFEGYNVLIQNWHYKGLPDSPILKYLGYTWSFATIYPAVFITRDFLAACNCCRWMHGVRLMFSNGWLVIMLLTGGFFMVYPVISPSSYHAPMIWTGFFFLLAPVNYWCRGPSILRELAQGNWQNFWALFIAGFICGILWEFWNYWAAARWIYTVPYPPHIKLFEMPVIGYLGFPAFALECGVMYNTAVLILGKAGISYYRRYLTDE